jgi:hypothetical protein
MRRAECFRYSGVYSHDAFNNLVLCFNITLRPKVVAMSLILKVALPTGVVLAGGGGRDEKMRPLVKFGLTRHR